MSRLAAVLLAAGLGTATHVAEAAPAVVSASPQGEVAQVRQVTVKFSESVVAFGDPRLADPFVVACQGAAPAGAGRWASDRVWLYDFREALPPGTRCTAKLRPEWRPSAASGAAAAAPLTGPKEFSFSTGGPAIVSMQPGDGAEIEEDQHFLIRLNGPAVEATVLANARCEVEGIGERLPLVLLGGEQRTQLLKARRIRQTEWPRLLIARCERPLANNAALRLVWGKGIAAAANPQVLTTIEQHFRLRVRAAFTAEFSCEREKAAAPCWPIRPMSLRFSAPVPRALAAQVRLAPASGEPLAPVFDKDDKAAEVTEIAFPKPLAENAAYSVVVPRELKDNAGRPLANASAFPLKVATGAAPPIAKFAAAPFGVIERHADAMLPVTLRHVQAELRGDAAAAASAPAATSAGQVRVRRLQSDAEILAWYAKLQKYHETQLTAEELGLPKSEWTTTEDDVDAKGRPIKRKVPRRIGTREVSLLGSDAGAPAARAAAARRRRPAAVRGGRPAARRAGLPRGRDRVAASRPGAARQARTDVRAHRRARHQPRRALQARAREQRRLGDDARPRQAGRRRRDRGQRLRRHAALDRAQRRQGPGGRGPGARCELRQLPRRQRLLRHRAQGR